ncbi:unnamed protein product, partial [Mesorhabditis belari]|uniref:sphinganine-1-phosphate aldolase n=1 Tax=Mesorhabditis belari TaxID=2138241 RepID=A0AAF3E8Z2_9BILA
MTTRSDISIFYAYFYDFEEALDIWREKFNRTTGHLESWQVVCYTFSLIFFRFMAQKDSLIRTLNRRSFTSIHSFNSSFTAMARAHFEEEIHKDDFLREFYKFLPERGLDSKDLQREAREYSTMGQSITPASTMSAEENETLRITQEITAMFLRNGSLKGIRKMEAEIVKMISSMLHAGHGSTGVVTNGNTESILLVLYGARRRAASLAIEHPEVLLPASAHPAFTHVANLLKISIIRVPVDKDDKVDVLRLKRRICSSTALIVVSAPNHSTGTMDDVSRVAKISSQYNVPLHVDSSLGGFLLPFLELADIHYPHIDFRLAGVTSMALDIDGHGKCPQKASALIFRDEAWIKCHTFIDTKNRIGIYTARTLHSFRDPATISSAWATLLSTGRDGYVDSTSMIVETCRKLIELLKEIKEIEILGSPDLCLVSFTTNIVDVYALGEKLIDEDWKLEIGANCLRLPITLELYEKNRIQTFVADLEDAISALLIDTTYASESKTAALHRMIESTMDHWLVEEMLRAKLLAEHSTPAPIERTYLRSISIDGRKMSTIIEK